MILAPYIRHNFSAKKALRLPEIVANWNDVADFFSNFISNASEDYKREIVTAKPKWMSLSGKEMNIQEADFEKYWKWKSLDWKDGATPPIFSPVLICFWGEISLYRQVLRITPYYHKYANLFYPECGENILAMNRLLAQHLGETEILYCVDSAIPPAKINEYAYMGNSIEDVKNWANKTFGKPPTEINEAIHNYYFIDDVNAELQ